MLRLTLILICLFGTPLSHAETLYVTDLLRLSVSELPAPGARQITSLDSGDAVTVLDRQPGYVRVKTATGITGWCKAAYLVQDKPARLILAELEEQITDLEAQLLEEKNESRTAQKQIVELHSIIQATEKNAKQHQEQLQTLKQQNHQYESSFSHMDSYLTWNIFIASIIASLLLGMYFGWYFQDLRSRRRHGGFRL